MAIFPQGGQSTAPLARSRSSLESHEGILGQKPGGWVCCAKGTLFLARRKHVLLEGDLKKLDFEEEQLF